VECARLPEAELCHPFGQSTAVFKIVGKMFAALSLADHPGRITLKCDPGYAAALADQHQEITPGYHMSKRHWITVTLLPSLAPDLVEDLISESYHLVLRTSSRAAR
jgi:predicted DNA-binding protein (MmcQ/YjbR family)